MSNSILIPVIILGYIIAYLFYRYGKTYVTEPEYKWIKYFFYIASAANVFCSSFLIYNFYL